MKRIIPALLLIPIIGGCSSTEPGIRPVPDSLTYRGQPASHTVKAPVGSTFTHEVRDEFGHRAQETYRIEADRSVTLLRRDRIDPDD
ncbi:hypothetical protein BJF93_10300 [Xaviernesmea oryzae]|uniref:Uncharacterized protein n=1 Tax=Xaviernesmea oryzae TaxID=464029 RepID=A0A1Q9AXE7_9HYPH|nr:hypothetical protein [Xaviernesmea oryzae]OLP60127.1 hypothetical protein BJF93_10300 [Xaviernesmea oryzae]